MFKTEPVSRPVQENLRKLQSGKTSSEEQGTLKVDVNSEEYLEAVYQPNDEMILRVDNSSKSRLHQLQFGFIDRASEGSVLSNSVNRTERLFARLIISEKQKIILENLKSQDAVRYMSIIAIHLINSHNLYKIIDGRH